MERWRRTLPLVAWLGALAVGLAVFHGIGQVAMAPPPLTDPGAWGPWLDAREPTVAVVAVLRLIVLALAWYLVGATTVGVVARLVRSAGLVRVADTLTLPMVRRLLQGALGVTLATTMVGASTAPVTVRADESPRMAVAAASQDSPGPTLVRVTADVDPEEAAGPRLVRVADGRDDADDVRNSGPLSMRLVEQGDAAADGSTAVPPPEVADPPSGTTVDDATVDDTTAEGGHTVVAGESLWSIAQDTLALAWEREPADVEVHDYWQRVIEHNRDALADPDNPDLIFPGDEVQLPAVPDPAGPTAGG